MAISAHSKKKPGQPSQIANRPVGAASNTRGTPIRLDSNAYCVAVKRRSVSAPMKPTNAAVPRPAVKFSTATTAASAARSGGYQARMTKPSVEIIWPNPNHHSAR